MLDKNIGLRIIAEHYGLISRLGLLQEECAELIQAVSKLNRGLPAADNLYEEIADVEIMLEQVKHLMDCRLEVDMWEKSKIGRTLQKLKQNELQKFEEV